MLCIDNYKQFGIPKPHISSIRLKIQDVAPAAPMEESWITLVVNHPQHIELLRQRQLWVQLGISRTASSVVAGFTVLRLGCIHHLLVAIKPSQA